MALLAFYWLKWRPLSLQGLIVRKRSDWGYSRWYKLLMAQNSSFIIVQIVLIVAYPCIKSAPFLAKSTYAAFSTLFWEVQDGSTKGRWGRAAQHGTIAAYANRL